MLTRGSLRKIALVTMLVFAWINMVAEYGYSQQMEDPLSRARELYRGEQYDAAIQELNAFVRRNQGDAGQKEQVASAYYLLAKIYYELRDDGKMGEMLAALFAVSPRYAQEEFNEGFSRIVGEYMSKAATAAASGEPAGSVEKPAKDAKKKVGKKKKKFPVLLVIGGAIVIGLVVYLLLKKPKYTLTVSMGEGVSGSPGSGSYEYKKGTAVNYFYASQGDYKNLQVLLDGQAVGNNGSIKMDGNHSLVVTAQQKPVYSLKVTKGAGVNGTPETGSTNYFEGGTVYYSYSLQSGYDTLAVKLDGATVAASGSFFMNGNRTLQASATEKVEDEYFTLWVIGGTGDGDYENTPIDGTYKRKKGQVISYKYVPGIWWDEWYYPRIYLDDVQLTGWTGSFVMNKDHVLLVKWVDKYGNE